LTVSVTHARAALMHVGIARSGARYRVVRIEAVLVMRDITAALESLRIAIS
jgi:hypothetical protein